MSFEATYVDIFVVLRNQAAFAALLKSFTYCPSMRLDASILLLK